MYSRRSSLSHHLGSVLAVGGDKNHTAEDTLWSTDTIKSLAKRSDNLTWNYGNASIVYEMRNITTLTEKKLKKNPNASRTNHDIVGVFQSG